MAQPGWQDPTPMPPHAIGVPAGSPSCAAAATKGDDYVVLRCQWDGGTPAVALRWRNGGDGRPLGDPAASTVTLVLSTNGGLRGREFVCTATHPLQAATAECRLRLGKPAGSLRYLFGCPHGAAAQPPPVSPVPLQRSPSWRRRGARWRCWRVVRPG